MKMRKGRIRWLYKDRWSAWYDLGSRMPEELKQIEVTAVEVQQEMTKEEFEVHEMTFNELTGAIDDNQARTRNET